MHLFFFFFFLCGNSLSLSLIKFALFSDFLHLLSLPHTQWQTVEVQILKLHFSFCSPYIFSLQIISIFMQYSIWC